MRTALESRRTGTAKRDSASRKPPLSGAAPQGASSGEATSKALLDDILHWLSEAKAEDVVAIDLDGKSSIGDYMVIASGRSDRHVGAIADQVSRHMKDLGFGRVRVEGTEACDWVLIDAGEIIVHLFRPEVREFYNLERMWSGDRPAEGQTH